MQLVVNIVDDLDKAIQFYTTAREIESYPWGRLAVMSDPFGHGFCVLQFSGGGYEAAA
jgi:predicted enzyme related to lactoylglutathione lyase